jgi:hypothetical protein
LKSLDDICWNDIADPESDVVQSGYFLDWNGRGGRDYLENWFIASAKGNEAIDRWQKLFNLYWNDRTKSTDIEAHPLFHTLDLNHGFNGHGDDFKNYLTEHVAFKKLVNDDPVMRELFEKHMKLEDAGERGFLLSGFVGWDEEQIFQKLIGERDDDLVEELLQRSDVLKLASSMAKRINKMSREELLNGDTTLGALLRRIRAATA